MAGTWGWRGHFQDGDFIQISSTLVGMAKRLPTVPAHGLFNMEAKRYPFLAMQCFEREHPKRECPRSDHSKDPDRNRVPLLPGLGVTSAKFYWSQQSKSHPDSRGGTETPLPHGRSVQAFVVI